MNFLKTASKLRFLPHFAIAAFATLSLSPMPAQAQDQLPIFDCFDACSAYYGGVYSAAYQGCRQECIRVDAQGGSNPPGGTKPISDRYCDSAINKTCNKN